MMEYLEVLKKEKQCLSGKDDNQLNQINAGVFIYYIKKVLNLCFQIGL